MALPPLLSLPNEAAYRRYFNQNYVRGPAVVTFDGIRVRFFSKMFAHAFFRDSSRTAHDKANFDRARAERMNWIRAVLEDSSVELYRRDMKGKIRRIALAFAQRYVVIIQISPRDAHLARFITAYIVDSDRALRKMRSNPVWRRDAKANRR